MAERIKPALLAVNQETAEAFLQFAVARHRRHTLAARLQVAGYDQLARDVHETGLMAQFGQMTDPQSPMALMLADLRSKGLLPKG
jgi:hypothetical protein